MSAVLKQCAVSAMAVAVLILAGCSPSAKAPVSEETTAAKAPAGPPQPVTAKTAFWPMYTAARSWATDFVTLSLTLRDVPGYESQGGKGAVWEATFGSPSLRQYRVYSYSIAKIPPDIYRGVVARQALPWGGISRDEMPIEPSGFNVDSDAAYTAATTDAAGWLKKNPNKKLSSFELRNAFRFQTPVWYLMWGDKKSGYVAFVDATTGKVIKK